MDFSALLLMQEPSAVVGEESAGAALKPGPGADPSDFPSVPSSLEPQPCPGTRWGPETGTMTRDQGSEPDPPQYGRLGLRPSGRSPPCGAAGPRRPGTVEPARAPEPWLGGSRFSSGRGRWGRRPPVAGVSGMESCRVALQKRAWIPGSCPNWTRLGLATPAFLSICFCSSNSPSLGAGGTERSVSRL